MAKAVGFTPDSAQRIADVVRTVERGPAAGGMGWYSSAGDGEPVIGKTTAEWKKGTAGTFTLYTGKPGAEKATTKTVRGFNLFADIPAGMWVASVGGYVIAAEC